MVAAQSLRPEQERLDMDNSGDGPLRVPGFGDIPLDYELPGEDRFAHGHDEWYQVPGVTIRELAMIAAMNILTDKHRWHVGIFDDTIAESWRAEAEAAFPRLSGDDWRKEVRERLLLSQKAWEWCLLELRDKAEDYKRQQFVRVLDTGSSVCKSDTIVSSDCADELKAGLAVCYDQYPGGGLPPRFGGTTDIVDPYLYPLVYGKSLVLQNGDTLDLDVTSAPYSRAMPAPGHENKIVIDPSMQQFIEGRLETSFLAISLRTKIPWDAYRWSSDFQWLPCEVKFLESTGTKVQISSYVNGLHPTHKTIYDSLEVILARSVKMWNECLIKGMDVTQASRLSDGRRKNDQRQRGRVPMRIVSYGIRSGPTIPEWAIHFDGHPYKTGVGNYLQAKDLIDNFPAQPDAALRYARRKAKNIIHNWRYQSGEEQPPVGKIASPTPEQWNMAREFLESPELGNEVLPEDWKETAYELMKSRVAAMQQWDYPEPGDAVSYADWRAGKDVHRATVDQAPPPETPRWYEYAPTDASHQQYAVRLEQQFRQEGLQVIIKIGGFESDADAVGQDPDAENDQWQTPGRLNEHIVATAIYIYDVANLHESRIEFRQVQRLNNHCYRYSETPPGGKFRESSWPIGEHQDIMLSMLNIKHTDICWDCNRSGEPSFQNVGEVIMPEGRLITFPNVMEHRFKPGKLIDKSIPGHCRFVTIYLVDPHYRICSTRNVPPQQHEWWSDAVSDLLVMKGLPRELADQICEATDEWPMGESEALRHREQQLRDRKPMDLARWRGAGILRF